MFLALTCSHNVHQVHQYGVKVARCLDITAVHNRRDGALRKTRKRIDKLHSDSLKTLLKWNLSDIFLCPAQSYFSPAGLSSLTAKQLHFGCQGALIKKHNKTYFLLQQQKWSTAQRQLHRNGGENWNSTTQTEKLILCCRRSFVLSTVGRNLRLEVDSTVVSLCKRCLVVGAFEVMWPTLTGFKQTAPDWNLIQVSPKQWPLRLVLRAVAVLSDMHFVDFLNDGTWKLVAVYQAAQLASSVIIVQLPPQVSRVISCCLRHLRDCLAPGATMPSSCSMWQATRSHQEQFFALPTKWMVGPGHEWTLHLVLSFVVSGLLLAQQHHLGFNC